MDTSNDPVRIDYDAELDVLRVALEPWPEDAVAIGDPDAVLMVDQATWRLLGIVFEDFLGMLERQAKLRRPESAAARRESFEHWLPLLRGAIPTLAAALAPVAKERLTDWLRLAGGASA